MRRVVLASTVAVFAFAGSAHAGTITGSIWENQPVPAGNATPANVPGTPANVTFSVDQINFQSGGLYTIGEFLNSNAGNNPTVFIGAGELGNSVGNTIWDFKGTVSVTNGQSFTAGHDDGLTLVIGATTVINAPGPTGFVNTTNTYTGPTGTFSFELVYGECCGAPAALAIDLPLQGAPVPGQTPLPGAMPLFASGLGMVGLLGWRRKRKASVRAA